MKFFFIVVFFASSNCLACPNMRGVWHCTGSEDALSLGSVTQANIPNGVVYHLTDQEGKTQDYYADGQSRPLHRDGNVGTILVRCVSNSGVQGEEEYTDESGNSTSLSFQYELTGENSLSGSANATVHFGILPHEASFAVNCQRR